MTQEYATLQETVADYFVDLILIAPLVALALVITYQALTLVKIL